MSKGRGVVGLATTLLVPTDVVDLPDVLLPEGQY